jgi:hypothetical protein
MVSLKAYTQKKYSFPQTEVLASLGLFLLALGPRAYALSRFVTADEAKWVYRSAQFLAAFLRGDWAGTSVNLTPAVTTTWIGSLGLWLYYWFNSATIGQPLLAWLESLPEFQLDLPILVATRWIMVLFSSLSLVLIYIIACRLFDPRLAFLGVGLMALDPHPLALSRILGHDTPTAIFMILSLLLFLTALVPTQPPSAERPVRTPGVMAAILFSGVMAGLAFLSKGPALFLLPSSSAGRQPGLSRWAGPWL